VAKGISLHIGLNRIDPRKYGTDGALQSCVTDARDMTAIAKANGFTTQTITDAAATADAVINKVKAAASALAAGDIFLLTYAGHGAQIPDVTADDEDGKDETWVLFDRMLLDDELHALWGSFQPGVRISVISDSCHSGTILRDFPIKMLAPLLRIADEDSIRPRCIAPEFSEAHFEKFKDMYVTIKRDLPRAVTGGSVLLVSACQDSQTAADTPTNGLFTHHLKKVWNNGSFSGSYEAFRDAINTSIHSPAQVPNYYTDGTLDAAFAAQTPFYIGARDIVVGPLKANGKTMNGARCHLDIVFDRGFEGFGPEHGIPDFDDRVIPIVEATLQRVRDFNLTAANQRGWEAGCKVSDGHVSCEAKVSGGRGNGADAPLDGPPTMRMDLATERLFAIDEGQYQAFLNDVVTPFARELWEKWGVLTTRSRDMDDGVRGGWDVSCSANSHGDWECHGGISGSF